MKNMNPNAKQTPAAPIKICVAFDEEASARSAEILIKHIAADHRCDTQSFHFDALDAPAFGVAAARTASAMDLLVIAVRDDHMLPPHVQSWLSLCLGLRDEDATGAVVLLVPKAAEEPHPDTSLSDYLETVATIGGMAFFHQRRTVPLWQGQPAAWKDIGRKPGTAESSLPAMATAGITGRRR